MEGIKGTRYKLLIIRDMKTKQSTKMKKVNRAVKTGLTNALGENPRTRKELNEIRLFFLEDSLTDYQFSYNSQNLR
jgi:hypothetical protein